MRFLLATIALAACLTVAGCGCSDDQPTVMLVNNGTGKADIQIKTSGGNTENINNIQPGTASERRSFAQGDIEFTISIQGVDDPVVYDLRADYCHDYDVTISGDNTVSSSGVEQ